MLLIRQFEKTVQAMLRNGELPGFAHLYMGEEATAAGVMAHLRPDDWITSTHRGTRPRPGQGRARPGCCWPSWAARRPAAAADAAARMHLSARGLGLFGTNGVVAGGFPRPSAWPSAPRSAAPTGRGGLLGDGASTTGPSTKLNLAGVQNAAGGFRLRKQPLRDGHALEHGDAEPEHRQQGRRLRHFPASAVDGNDVIAVWQAAGEAIGRAAPARARR